MATGSTSGVTGGQRGAFQVSQLANGSTSGVVGGQREHFRCHRWPTGPLQVSQLANGYPLPLWSQFSDDVSTQRHAPDIYNINTALHAAQARSDTRLQPHTRRPSPSVANDTLLRK